VVLGLIQLYNIRKRFKIYNTAKTVIKLTRDIGRLARTRKKTNQQKNFIKEPQNGNCMSLIKKFRRN